MTDRPQAVAAPIPVKLAGQEYKASRWTQRDFGEWEEWVRKTYRERAMDGAAALPLESQTALAVHVFERAGRLTFISPESSNLLASVEGFVRAWHMSLSKHHSDLTMERVAELLLDPATDYDELAELPMISTAAKGNGKARKVKGPRKKKPKPPIFGRMKT